MVPSKLTIGHIVYDVVVNSEKVDAVNKDFSGFSHVVDQVIGLREDSGPDYQVETLLHEILHQCLRVSGYNPNGDKGNGEADLEERTISAICGPLVQTLRNNPDLVSYFLRV